MDEIVFRSYDHLQVETIDDDLDQCVACGENICKHLEIDPESTCVFCGEYVQEISNERPWSAVSYTYGNQTVKAQDHTKILRGMGFDNDVIRASMKKYTKIDNRVKNEMPIVAACTFLAFQDVGKPKTIHEIAKIFKLTRSKLQKALKSVYTVFPEYLTKYITVSSMIRPLLEKLEIQNIDKYHPHIYKIAKYVEKTWNECEGSKRSTPQNIASVIIYKYISKSPTLNHMLDDKGKEPLFKKLQISQITVNNIEKTLVQLVNFD